LRLLAGFGPDEEFLQAFGGLGDGLQSARDRPLNPDGPGPAAVSEGLAAVRVTDDDSPHPIHGFDPANQGAALLRGALMSSAGGHRVGRSSHLDTCSARKINQLPFPSLFVGLFLFVVCP
jgi:hypothetical protein